MKEMWVKCMVWPGMFATEAVVVIKVADGQQVSFFVPIEKVDPKPTAGCVEGRIRVRYEASDKAELVTIPSPQPVTIAVNKGELLAA